MRKVLVVTAAMLLPAWMSAGCEKKQGPGSMEPTIVIGEAQPPVVERPLAGEESPTVAAEGRPPVRLEDLTPPPSSGEAGAGEDTAASSGEEFVYTVVKGDTLWSLSKRHLGSGNRWREIVAANPGLEPRTLRVGRKIVIPAK